jgi:hypothetical protein
MFPTVFSAIIYIALTSMLVYFGYNTLLDVSLFPHQSGNSGKSIGLASEKHGILLWNSTTVFLVVLPDVHSLNKDFIF